VGFVVEMQVAYLEIFFYEVRGLSETYISWLPAPPSKAGHHHQRGCSLYVVVVVASLYSRLEKESGLGGIRASQRA
jgi:hypothetical protein